METKQVNLKERIMATYKNQWKEEHEQELAKLKEQKNNEANAEEQFKAAFPEFYSLLEEAGLYRGFETRKVDGYFEEPVLVIGTVEDSFHLRFDNGRIQPHEGASFDVWSIDKLLDVVGRRLNIVPDKEFYEEKNKYMEELRKG